MLHPGAAGVNRPWHMAWDGGAQLGEAPCWLDGALFWSDIERGELWRLAAAGGPANRLYHDRPVGGFTRQADGALLLFRDRGNVMHWPLPGQPGEARTLVEALPGEQASRFNDVLADPAGRVFCGTLSSPDKAGALYRLDPDGQIAAVLEGLGTPNGMGLTPTHDALYVTDTRARTIWRHDYDVDRGELGARTAFYVSDTPPARPDGLCVDVEGCVWTALYEGGAVLRLSPAGEVLERITLPARYTTSLCFGAPGRGELFVTSAGGPARAQAGPHAGAVFRLEVNVEGGPVYDSRILLQNTGKNARNSS